jgi:hypothetical protein
MLIDRFAVGVFQKITHFTRRVFTGFPSSITPESERAWLAEQIRVYATLQPYSSPLTTPTGGFGAGETWEMRRGYREAAMREPSVKAALLTKVLAVASLDPVVKPANKRRPKDREVRQFVDYAITHARGGWPGLIFDILFPSLVDGYSVTEPVWGHVDELALDYGGAWTITEVKSKDTEFIRFRLDTFRNITAVQAMNAGQGGMPFDPRDFLIFTHLSFFCNPFGVSDLRAANRAANMIESAIKLRAILLENFSGPYLIATAKDPAVRQKVSDLLGKARARGWIVVPEGATVELENLATSAPDQFQQTIRDYREEIVTAIQGAYLQLLEGGVTNSRGNTQVHQSISQLFQWWLACQVCELINHRLIPDLVHPNYGRAVGMPTVSLGGIDPAQVNAALARFKMLQDLGLDLSKEQIYDEGYAEEPRDEADRLKAPPPRDAQAPGGFPGMGGAGGGGGNPPSGGTGGDAGAGDPFGFADQDDDEKGGASAYADTFR